MFKAFLPTYYYNNVFELSSSFWNDNGIRGILFDIDNTLEPYASAVPSERTLRLFDELKKQNIAVAIISNNHKERVEKFATPLAVPFFYESLKPKIGNINSAIKEMGLTKEQVVLIGDQLFTDIWGGSRAGIRTVFVNRLSSNEGFFIKLKRVLEIPFVLRIKKAGYGKL